MNKPPVNKQEAKVLYPLPLVEGGHSSDSLCIYCSKEVPIEVMCVRVCPFCGGPYPTGGCAD